MESNLPESEPRAAHPYRAFALRTGLGVAIVGFLLWHYDARPALHTLARERPVFPARGDVVNAVWDPDDPGPFAQLIANEGPGGRYYCAC